MKRMVLIPEERLLRYEERDKQNLKSCTVEVKKNHRKMPYRSK